MDPRIFVLRGDFAEDNKFREAIIQSGLMCRVAEADFAVSYDSAGIGVINTIIFHKARYPIAMMSEDHWRMIGKMIQECEKEAQRAL